MTTNFPSRPAFSVTMFQLDELHRILGRTTVISGDRMTADIFDGDNYMYRVSLI